MNIGGAIVVFVLIWWCVFFAALPFGVRLDDDRPPGADSGAPVDPQLRRKAIVTTGISVVLWLIAIALIAGGVFDYRD